MDGEAFAKCSCPHCGGHIEFPTSAAGMQVTCPHCGQTTPLVLPEHAAAPSSAEPSQTPASPAAPTAAEVVAAFTGPVPRTPAAFFYRLGLVLVSLMMVLLPLVYLAMVVAAGWGVYYYATHFAWLLESTRGGGRAYLFKLMLYLGPLFVGLVLVFFMVKPLFARRAPSAQPLALNPDVEPTLFAFIARICELVGAPMPTRIDLDCQLNAAASFRRGALSLFRNDLVLTLGLPLVATLNLREFAGVIAHEFGHFTQGFGMRASYVIRTVNGWFARVVYERDAWDVTLAQWVEESGDVRVALVVGSAQFAVGCSRFLLKLLMLLGHGVSCFLLRQMEYDADSYEIKLAGSAVFESTARRLAVISKALEQTYKEMRVKWNLSRHLPDNFPAYLAHRDAATPPAIREQIQDTLGLATTGVFDSHPSDGDRIRQARRADEPGVFHLDLPATVLFSNFEAAAKQVTQLHYADDLGIPFDPSMLRPIEASAATAREATSPADSSAPVPASGTRLRVRLKPPA